MYTLKKSLGQHFLHDQKVVDRILAALSGCTFDQLLEIGPGGGALTRHLLELKVNFRAVEIDAEKVDYLLAAFPVIHGKLLNEDVLSLQPPFTGRFAVIGNFPYNISTEILFRLIDWKDQVNCVVGMFQKEVAQRIAAPPGSRTYGITSVLTQAVFSVEYLFEVSESAFQPPPKVKSAVLRLLPLAKTADFTSWKSFVLLVKTAFNQRRKTLRNATRTLFDAGTLQEAIFEQRAEQLSVEQFATLTLKMKTPA
ncbi:MAG TPA: 16S rRNA (adenine(1518)-N(6)/adenine(1519)-N(6))-dimethyltransferase RsmA [Chitinophagaceae bacterium]